MSTVGWIAGGTPFDAYARCMRTDWKCRASCTASRLQARRHSSRAGYAEVPVQLPFQGQGQAHRSVMRLAPAGAHRTLGDDTHDTV